MECISGHDTRLVGVSSIWEATSSPFFLLNSIKTVNGTSFIVWTGSATATPATSLLIKACTETKYQKKRIFKLHWNNGIHYNICNWLSPILYQWENKWQIDKKTLRNISHTSKPTLSKWIYEKIMVIAVTCLTLSLNFTIGTFARISWGLSM